MKIKNIKSFYENSLIANSSPALEIGHFNILKVEDLIIPNKPHPELSRRSFFKISYVEGKSTIHYVNRTISINGPTLVFTNPLSPYDWEVNGEPQTGYVCIFTADFVKHFINLQKCPLFASAENSVLPLPIDLTAVVKDIFLRIAKELDGNYKFKYDLIRHMLLEIIHYGLKEHSHETIIDQQRPSYERIYLLFITLLDEQFLSIGTSGRNINKSPAFFAEEIGLHINHLNKALKAITGQNTTQLIQKKTLEEAMFLLKSTTLSVKEIAWKLGFEQANYFASFFKRNIHQAPHVFRAAVND